MFQLEISNLKLLKYNNTFNLLYLIYIFISRNIVY